MGMNLEGLYYGSLDDKGRFLLPGKMRAEIPLSTLVIVKGNEKCLWLFAAEEWKGFRKAYLAQNPELNASDALFDREAQQKLRRVNQFSEIDLDKSGRMLIAATYRNLVDIERKCILIGMGNHIEIWAEEVYKDFFEGESSDRDG